MHQVIICSNSRTLVLQFTAKYLPLILFRQQLKWNGNEEIFKGEYSYFHSHPAFCNSIEKSTSEVLNFVYGFPF